MPNLLLLLMDENVPGPIFKALRQLNPVVDVVRARDVGLGEKPDAEILSWAARNNRVLVTLDRNTLENFAWNRVRLGEPMPGVIYLWDKLSPGKAAELLELYALLKEPDELRNRVIQLPESIWRPECLLFLTLANFAHSTPSQVK